MQLVFVSYAHSDGDIADAICDVLDEMGISYFRDVKDINWGDTLDEAVQSGVRNSEMLIVVISNASVKSRWVPYEIGQATALKKRILPFVTSSDLGVPYYIRKLTYVTDLESVSTFFRSYRESHSSLPSAYRSLPSARQTLLTIYLALLVAGVAGGSKVIAIGVGNLSAAVTVISFAFTYLITDMVHQVYGESEAKKFVIPGLVAMSVAAFFLWLFVQILPHNSYPDQDSYRLILSLPPRMFISGLIAFVISQFCDIAIFQRLISVFPDKWRGFRNLVSTLLSQLIDTSIFIPLAFIGRNDDILNLLTGHYLVKVFIAVVAVPLFLAVTRLLRDERMAPSHL